MAELWERCVVLHGIVNRIALNFMPMAIMFKEAE
jgi:hypothetical protein